MSANDKLAATFGPASPTGATMNDYTPTVKVLAAHYCNDRSAGNYQERMAYEAKRHEEFDRAIAKVRAEAKQEAVHAIERVNELHAKTYHSVSDELYDIDPRCDECGQSYPCTTIERLKGL